MKPKLLTILLCYVLQWLTASVYAQTPVADSIRNTIFSAKDNSQKLDAILNYCNQYQSLNRDTAYEYAVLALRMARQAGEVQIIAKAELALANAYSVWGWTDSVRAVCNSALQKCSAANSNTRDVYFKLMRQKAMSYGAIEKFPEALAILYQLLREAEVYNDLAVLSSTRNTIGSVNILMEKPDEALAWIKKAMLYQSTDKNYLPVKASILTNASYAYLSRGSYDSARIYIDAALPVSREAQNLNILATALRIRSKLYVSLHQNDQAEKDLREMIVIRRELNGGGNSAITDDNIQIADFYANTGQLQKAIAFCKENIKTGDIYNTSDSVSFNNHLSTKLDFYKALAGYYKQAGMTTEYTATLENMIAAKDSFYVTNNAQAIADMQTKYETEQKEKTILQQKYDLSKKNAFVFGSLILLLLSVIIFYLLFRIYRGKQVAKMEFAMQKEQLSKRMAVKEAEEKERRRIAADLHDNLGVQANAILYNTGLLKNETAGNDTLVGDLHDTAKQMLLNLRETLWAMKANDITAAELWIRIISFSKQMGRHYNRILFFTRGSAPPGLHVSSVKALNIVMTIQEAVQNAVKHSGANEITISSVLTNKGWQIAVLDDGKGFAFEEAYTKRDSHGLKNMHNRATESGFRVTVNSDEEMGTSVEITVSG